jgi:imidazolonepropionase-like amidohydrolase
MIRAACALMLLALTPARGPAQPPDVDALVGKRVYVAPDRPPLEDATVVFRHGIITAVGPRGVVQVPPDARVVDCTGRTVLAAFWNSHVHFTEPKWSEASSAPPVLQAALDAMLLQYGFAFVFDTGSFPAVTLALKRRIEAGELNGPGILTTGIGHERRRAVVHPDPGVADDGTRAPVQTGRHHRHDRTGKARRHRDRRRRSGNGPGCTHAGHPSVSCGEADLPGHAHGD